MFRSFGDCVPRVGERVYVDPSAQVIGRIDLCDDVTVLPGAVLRAEVDRIVVGAGSVVEDAAVLHVDEGGMRLGERVVVGHAAVVHCAQVGAGTLIGMGATVLAGARVGRDCLVAAGALVPENTQIPDGSLVMGVPARVVRPVSDDQRAYMAMAADYYRDWGARAASGDLSEVEPQRLSADQ